MRTSVAAAAAALAAASLAGGCGPAPTRVAQVTTTTPPATTTPATTPLGTTPPATTPLGTTPPATTPPTTTPLGTTPTTPAAPTAAPGFDATTSAVTATALGASWHAGCPVSPAQLTDIGVGYWGFDGAAHRGDIVVATSVVPAVEHVFELLWAAHFPLQRVVPVAAYGGSDDAAAAADDTSGFNCRAAVAPGPPQWSVHAYGEAIDVNDVQNPYLDGSRVIPPAGAAYADRYDVRPGMAEPGGVLVEAFASVGWQWGGCWGDTPDYQHFSATGG